MVAATLAGALAQTAAPTRPPANPPANPTATAPTEASAVPLKLELPGAGPYEIWWRKRTEAPSAPQATPINGPKADVTLDLALKDAALYLRNPGTGRLARILGLELKANTWKVAEADFRRWYAATFLFISDGKPVSAGSLQLTIGSERRTLLLVPADRGQITAYDLAEGPMALMFETKDTAGKVVRHEQALPKLTQTSSIPVIQVDLPPGIAPAETAAAAPANDEEQEAVDAAKAEQSRAAETNNPVAQFFNLLIGLGVVGAIGYALWRYYQNNQAQVDEVLKKAGVAQDPADPTGTMPSAPTPAPRTITKIALPDAAPTAASAEPMNLGAALPDADLLPRLRGDDGLDTLLHEGTTTVGRENATLTFAQESSLSRRHAEIVRTGGSVIIRDLGSTNGTWVNGARIQADHELKPGDTVQLGAIRFRYEA